MVARFFFYGLLGLSLIFLCFETINIKNEIEFNISIEFIKISVII